MGERPEALKRLEVLLGTSVIAHESIADLHSELATRGHASSRSRDLLRESAAITLHRLPQTIREAGRLARRWDEESALDPSRAADTLLTLAAELDRVRPTVGTLLTRQRDIATELQALVEDEL